MGWCKYHCPFTDEKLNKNNIFVAMTHHLKSKRASIIIMLHSVDFLFYK